MNHDNLEPVIVGRLKTGDKIVLKTKKSGQVAIPARYQSQQYADSSNHKIVVQIEGTDGYNGFDLREWTVYVEKTYPLPSEQDIQQLLFNIVAEGQATGNPPSYSSLAESIIGLMKGEYETPVPQYEPTAVPEVPPAPTESETLGLF